MSRIEKFGGIFIDKKEFCKKIGIGEDHWMFERVGQNPKFWMYPYHDPDNPERYHFDNDLDCVREFKYMRKYKEIWSRSFTFDDPQRKSGSWSLWNTWSENEIPES